MSSLDVTPTLLVIEDDDDVRELLLSHVRALGWSARGVGSATEGVEYALTHFPDVIVVDILLPDLDGRHVVRTLRADPRTSSARMVLNSVLDVADYRHTIADLAIDAILPKPFTRRDVALLLGMLEAVPSPAGGTPTGKAVA